MVKKIIKRRKPAEETDPFALQAGPVIHDEDADVDYHAILNTEYFMGFDDHLKWFVYDPDSETGWDHLSGWGWYSDRRTLLRNFARFLADEAPLPKFKIGAVDIHDTNRVALADAPYHPRFPVIDPDLDKMLPKSETFYRWDPKAKRVTAMVTVDSEGVALGWDQCGGCSQRLRTCRCAKGSVPSRGIVWCVERSADGWSTEARTTRSYVPSTSSNAIGTAPTSRSKPSTRPAPARTTATPAPVPTASSKPAQKAVGGLMGDLDSGNLDLGAVAKAAQDSADASTKSVRKVIKKRKST